MLVLQVRLFVSDTKIEKRKIGSFINMRKNNIFLAQTIAQNRYFYYNLNNYELKDYISCVREQNYPPRLTYF